MPTSQLMPRTTTSTCRRFEIPANLSINPQKSHRISNKLMGIFFEDISHAADGGLSAEMLQNGDFGV